MMNEKEFAEYVWSFYGPGEIYGKFFDNTLTRKEVLKAVRQRMKSFAYEGDSFDREAVRDLMLEARGKPAQGLG